MMRKWQIQVSKESFDGVTADSCEVKGGGSLVFKQDGRVILALAPGQWLSVHDDEEANARLRAVK